MLTVALSRTSFETAMQVAADEVLHCASPVGYPAQKMSVREFLMRKGIKADQRLPFDILYFRGSFDDAGKGSGRPFCKIAAGIPYKR